MDLILRNVQLDRKRFALRFVSLKLQTKTFELPKEILDRYKAGCTKRLK